MSLHLHKSKTEGLSHQSKRTPEELTESYKKLASEIWNKTWDLLTSENQWVKETPHQDLDSGIIYSQRVHGNHHHGKIFMLEGYVESSPEEVFHETVIRIEESPTWNPTVKECKTVQVVDENTDISHNITNEAVGGLVSSRDFVNLRHWKMKDNVMISAGCSVIHPSVPPSKKHVRGENGPGGWFYKPCPQDPNRCIFGWIINTDIKGWIPQYLVEQAVYGTLLQFLKHLRLHMNRLKSKAPMSS